MTIHPGFVGIDVSKAHLDIFDTTTQRAIRIANDAAPLADLVRDWAGRGAFVLFEATGRYDRILHAMLADAGIRCARVNPARARSFARAAGFLAKTDAVDARMLAAMAQGLDPQPDPPPSQPRIRLAGLNKRRDQLVAARQQERTRRHEATDPILAASIDDHIAWLSQAIAAIEADIAAAIRHQPGLEQQRRLLASVPGVGPVTAAVLIALMPELGAAPPKKLAALAGLAPLNNDSGTRRGKRSIRGGRKRVRDALYLAAFVAIQRARRFRAFYETLLGAGKPPKLARIAVARKLLTVLNAILRDQQPFHA